MTLLMQNEAVDPVVHDHHDRHGGGSLNHSRSHASKQTTHSLLLLLTLSLLSYRSNHLQCAPDALPRFQHLLPGLHHVEGSDHSGRRHAAHRARNQVLQHRREPQRLRRGAQLLVDGPVNGGEGDVTNEQRLQAVVERLHALSLHLRRCLVQQLGHLLAAATGQRKRQRPRRPVLRAEAVHRGHDETREQLGKTARNGGDKGSQSTVKGTGRQHFGWEALFA